MHILVTGGTGYIGTHVIVQLIQAGHEVAALDNLHNSTEHQLQRAAKYLGRSIPLFIADTTDREELKCVLAPGRFDTVIHLAGRKLTGADCPFDLYDVNVRSTLALLAAMREAQVKNLLFSSTAAVYCGNAPVTEQSPTVPQTPYGRSKLMCEQILQDELTTDPWFNLGIFRYFNVAGAHTGNVLGESPVETPPGFITRAASAIHRGKPVGIYGTDWNTRDGTCVRDYLHVMDLADAHVRALEQLAHLQSFTLNLGSGSGSSVTDVLDAFDDIAPAQVTRYPRPRRGGDIAKSVADIELAEQLLGWRPTRGLHAICRDTYEWIKVAAPHY